MIGAVRAGVGQCLTNCSMVAGAWMRCAFVPGAFVPGASGARCVDAMCLRAKCEVPTEPLARVLKVNDFSGVDAMCIRDRCERVH